jgi:phage-related protein
MQRLLADAEKISGIKYDISSYADIVDAIHVVQNEMGITGTTAKEASSTISGSLSSMKGAWQNLLTGMGDDTQDFGALVDQFVSSVDTVGANLLPRIEIVLGGVVKLVQGLAPKIIEKIPELVSQLLPSIITASVSLIQAIVAIIPDLVNAIVEQIPLFIQGIVQIVSALVQALPTIIQSLMEAFTSSGAELLGSLTTGLREKIPEFLENALPMLVDFTAELSNNIGLIVDAGLDLIVALCEGLIDSLPTLIENIPQIVINICSIINDNAPKIITTAIFLIGQLIVGLIKAIPTLVQNIPKIIEAIVSVITAFNWINLGGKIVSGIADGVKNLPAKLLEFVKNAISNIKNAFTNGGIGGVVSNVFNGIKNSISNILGGAWDFVKNTIKNIKDIFKFSWSLPNLKLPHFGVSPRGWKIGDLLKGSIPKLSIAWYAKAMNNPMIMTKPTIFGYDAGTGNLLGGGEAGSELVVGTNTLLSMIKSAVASVLGGTKMSIEVPALQNVRAGSAGSDSGLSDKMDRLIELFKQFIESGDSDMTVPIYIGNELIDEYILNKNNRNVLRSGGHA